MTESKPNQIKVPVAILKAGETRSIQTVLEFPDPPVTFKLVEGSGPVYIHGQQVPGNYEIEDTVECVEEEEEVCAQNWRTFNRFPRPNINNQCALFVVFFQAYDEEIEEKVSNSKAKFAKNGKKN